MNFYKLFTLMGGFKKTPFGSDRVSDRMSKLTNAMNLFEQTKKEIEDYVNHDSVGLGVERDTMIMEYWKVDTIVLRKHIHISKFKYPSIGDNKRHRKDRDSLDKFSNRDIKTAKKVWRLPIKK